MSTSLGVVIQELNQSRKPSFASIEESPLESITMVLNSHLTSLEWIERQNQKLEGKVEALRSVQDKLSKSSERIHGTGSGMRL
jgi:hypothetical protein